MKTYGIERPKQTLSQDLLDDLLNFVRQKFYEGDFKSFAQDKRLLLKWAILYPAKWFNQRGVTMPGERYKKIFCDILLNALRMGNTGNITYRPAWLGKTVQSHFEHHGEEYYAEAKAARTLAEHALIVCGRSVAAGKPDPVSDLARAAGLLEKATRGKKRVKKTGSKQAVNLSLNL